MANEGLAPRLRQYLFEVWRCRFFWLSLTKMDLHARYRGSALGIGWSLLHPLAMTAVLCGVFQNILSVDPRQYVPFVLTGLLVWNYFSAAITEGCLSLYRAEGYLRSHNVPLAIFPLRTVLGIAFHAILTLAVACVIAGVTIGATRSVAIVSLIPSLVLLLVFGWSVTVIAGLANVFFPDTQHLAQIGLQALFYMTPVLYPPEIVSGRGLDLVLQLNPLTAFLQLIRVPILSGQFPPLRDYGVAMLLVAATCALATYLLTKLQKRVIFEL
ncbi:MAG: ABC transporter permease [Planctomycetota bacterium]